MYTIAEIPEHLRRSYTQVCGIWCDDIKPVMNTYFLPFCKKLKKYYNDGVICENEYGKKIKVKIISPLWIADAPARATIINFQNHNSSIPCKTCETTGEQYQVIKKNKKTRKKRYLPVTEAKKRTHEGILQDALEAIRIREPVKGVKGLSYICVLPLLDLSTCLVPELMHSLFLGVVKMFMVAWFTSNDDWSLKKHILEINEIVNNIQVTPDTKRLPRKVDDCEKFKASEFYDWLLTYLIPVLGQFMKSQYLEHFILLISAMEILLSNKILKTELLQAEIMLKKFVRDVQKLYSFKFLTYNLHQLLHFCLYTSRWGPLGSLTAFPFEDFNGLLVSITHGTKNIGQEIINSYQVQQSFNVLKEKRVKLIEKNIINNDQNSKVVGKSIKCTEKIFDILKSAGINDIQNVKCYDRAIINNQDCISTLSKKIKKNSSTFFLILENEEKVYGTALFYFVYKNSTYICLDILENIFKVKKIATKIFNTEFIKKIKSIININD